MKLLFASLALASVGLAQMPPPCPPICPEKKFVDQKKPAEKSAKKTVVTATTKAVR